MLSFGDLDNPDLDCEIYLTTFEIHKLQEYLNSIDLSEVPDCVIKPQRLNIIIKAVADNLETCSMCGVGLSSQMHCHVWKRNLQFTDFDSTDELYWVLEFSDFHLGYGSPDSEYHATQIQVECASFQLSELRGAINGLLLQVEKRNTEPEENEIDREARDNKMRNDKEKTHKKQQETIASIKSLGHRGHC